MKPLARARQRRSRSVGFSEAEPADRPALRTQPHEAGSLVPPVLKQDAQPALAEDAQSHLAQDAQPVPAAEGQPILPSVDQLLAVPVTTLTPVKRKRVPLTPALQRRLNKLADSAEARRHAHSLPSAKQAAKVIALMASWYFIIIIWPGILTEMISPYTQPWQNDVRETQFFLGLDRVFYGSAKPRVAMRLEHLGDIFFDRSMLDKADFYYRSAAAIYSGKALASTKVLSLSDLWQHRYREDCERIRREMRVQYQSAEVTAEIEKTIAGIKSGAKVSNDSIEDVLSFAELYRAKGAPSTAEDLLVRLIAALGTSSVNEPIVLHVKHHLANCYRTTGQFADATKLYEELLKRDVARWGDDHPDTAMVEVDYAKLLRLTGHEERARALDEKAMAVYSKLIR